jgi:F420-non-reducing hydrogenase large subunit
MSVRDAAKGLIHNDKVDQGILNMVEMAFRAYDPCFGCATHFAVGQMPLTLNVYDSSKRLIKTVSR